VVFWSSADINALEGTGVVFRDVHVITYSLVVDGLASACVVCMRQCRRGVLRPTEAVIDNSSQYVHGTYARVYYTECLDYSDACSDE